ncbi:MAG: phosphatase PAP2 family protein [Chitinophagia bacterium]|nr:phosphatase PAP2 family protein [Chitinophagia bacterium]
MPMKLSSFLLSAMILVVCSASLLFLGSWIMGKYAFFLLLNGNGGGWADHFFKWLTYLGDGWIWVMVFVFTWIYFRNRVGLVLLSVIISTLLSQTGKQVLFPNELRPAAGEIARTEIHTVSGVDLHTGNSFPSGHTTTAFTIFLLICNFIPKRNTIMIGYGIAVGVGYSRIYLAQHFPVDVAAGMLVGVCSVLCSLYIEQYLPSKKASHEVE